MASSKKVQVTLEIPAEIAKLSQEELGRLRSMFRTEMANVLSNKLSESQLSIVIRNTKPGGGGTLSLTASKKGGRKPGPRGAKKSSKKG